MLTYRVEQFGALRCHVLSSDSGEPPVRAIVLCHGFGAPGSDLAPVGEELCALEPELEAGTLFVFPEAPLSPPELRGFGGRAWWPLDMQRLQQAIAGGTFRDLRQDAPERLPAARAELGGLLSHLEHHYGLPVEHVLLGGFSQGSMLATDVTLHLERPPAGLLIFSGTLLSEPEWQRLAPRRRGLPVLQTHGTADPILPFAAAEWLRDLLIDAGCVVEFQSFGGGHTIPRSALVAAARRLRQIAS